MFQGKITTLKKRILASCIEKNELANSSGFLLPLRISQPNNIGLANSSFTIKPLHTLTFICCTNTQYYTGSVRNKYPLEKKKMEQGWQSSNITAIEVSMFYHEVLLLNIQNYTSFLLRVHLHLGRNCNLYSQTGLFP